MASPLRRSKSSDNLLSLCVSSPRPKHATVEFHGPPRSIVHSSGNENVRTMHHKCASNRVQLGERVIRCLSFFASHPSMCPEENWHPHHIGRDFLLIDTYTARLMSECQCQLLIDPDDTQEEPTIVAVELMALPSSDRKHDDGELSKMLDNVKLK